MTSTGTGKKSDGTAHPGTGDPGTDPVLVKPEWLAEHLHDPRIKVIEVDVSDAAYTRGHIDGAMLWNVYRDLKDPQYRTVDVAAIARLAGRSHIGTDTTVVFYGYAPAMGFWFLKLMGHADVRILDCSREAWQLAGRPWTDEAPEPGAGSYPVGSLQQQIRANGVKVRDAMNDADRVIADVRTELEFVGERFWPSGGMDPAGRAGHIPSAVHVPIDNLYQPDGAFRGRPELEELFVALDPVTGREVITYCTIGGRACTAWFVLSYLLDRPNVRVYDGSWAEWGRLPSSEVETTYAPTPPPQHSSADITTAAVPAGRPMA